MVIFSIVIGRLGTAYIYVCYPVPAELISTAITFGGKETRSEVKIIDVEIDFTLSLAT